MPIQRADAITEQLQVWAEEGWVAVDSEAAKAHLAAGGFSETSPLKVRTKVYDSAAHVRKPFRLAGAALPAVAARYEGLPVLDRRHDGGIESLIRGPAPVIGRVLAARAEGSGLWQDQALWGEDAIREIAGGTAQSYSIAVTDTEETSLSCSVCQAAVVEDDMGRHLDCEHVPGIGGCLVEWSDAEPTEVTRTYSPAVRGTGIAAIQLSNDDDTTGLALAGLSRLAERLLLLGAPAAPGPKGAAANLPTTVTLDTLAGTAAGRLLDSALEQKCASLEREVSLLRGQAAHREAEQRVLVARQHGKLSGDPAQLTELALRAGPVFDEILCHVPENRAVSSTFLAGIGSSPIPDEARGGKDWSSQLQIAASRMSTEQGITYEAAHQALYDQYRPLGATRESGAAQPRRGE